MRPLDPYLRGNLIWSLRMAMKPKDLVVLPAEVYKTEDMAFLSEITLIREWVNSWLNYVRWYYIAAIDPGYEIHEFFDAPVVARHWRASREDPHLVRFGLM